MSLGTYAQRRILLEPLSRRVPHIQWRFYPILGTQLRYQTDMRTHAMRLCSRGFNLRSVRRNDDLSTFFAIAQMFARLWTFADLQWDPAVDVSPLIVEKSADP